MLVLRQRQNVDANRVRRTEAWFQDPGVFLVFSAAQKREIADAFGMKVQFAPAVLADLVGEDRSGAGTALVGGDGAVNLIGAGLVKERLMPGDKRRRLPQRASGARLIFVAGT